MRRHRQTRSATSPNFFRAIVGVEPAAEAQRDLPRRQRMFSQMTGPGPRHRVLGRLRRQQMAMSEQREEPVRTAIPVQHQRDVSGGVSHQCARTTTAEGSPRAVRTGSTLDRQRLHPAGKVRLPHHRVDDQIQHVRRESPQLRAPSIPRLALRLPPRGAPVLPISVRTRTAQIPADGLPHRPVHDQSVWYYGAQSSRNSPAETQLSRMPNRSRSVDGSIPRPAGP